MLFSDSLLVWTCYISDLTSLLEHHLFKAAWGGQHDAVLPQKLRISSAISAVFLLFIISVILSFKGSISLYKSSLDGFSMVYDNLFFGIGIIVNAISRSKIERIWSPYSAVLCGFKFDYFINFRV